MSSKKIINSIQLLRGLAAVVVVVYHISGFVESNYNSLHIFGGLFNFGFVGVDLFFVISGFIIHFTSERYFNRPELIWEYFKKRFVRIFPIYWVIFFIMLICNFFLIVFFHQKMEAFDEVLVNPLEFFKTLILFPNHKAINAVSWTLSYELFFYFCISLLILSDKFKWVLVAILLVSFGNSFYLVPINGAIPFTPFNFVFSLYNFEFFFGFLLYYAYKNIEFTKLYPNIVILGLSFFVICFWGNEVADSGYYQRILVFGLPCVGILFSSLQLEKAGKLKIPYFFIKLGDASYALYLVHFPLMLIGNRIPKIFEMYVFHPYWEGINYKILIYVIIIGILAHQYLEKPLLKICNKALKIK
jgi:exopolysaccharide production protein ExoZ